ncbi:hypothetical protein SISSUDRAFT_1066309 [Sistotremastrum suecicum HHB10207 ss-3]|uniref:SPIN90/Ldb17 leucine-rich domain-containing protein n=1 Tax=Sistotremastrum suecicum HHB10207 ss-3 TaxID=1314776 RepID=A0A165YGS4_9AGAM|nr:hypothetical protein SISSUDRAFT_1066309 [Sistotremastrum suecicum HHB10207 ss-3]
MDIGIVYHIENAHQFWSELDDMLRIPHPATLSLLDGTLLRFVEFCAAHHEKYLQAQIQLEHACNLLLDSELFAFHSDRMTEILMEEASTNTDPHAQLILHKILLSYGHRHPSFLRSNRAWNRLIPLLIDHLLVDFDPNDEDHHIARVTATMSSGSATSSSHGHSHSGSRSMIGVPIEAKLRLLSVGMLYEVCRVRKFDVNDLRIFDDRFVEHLFDLVERTRDMRDETFNYAAIKLLIALNEQFMLAVASAATKTKSPQKHASHVHSHHSDQAAKSRNLVLIVLVQRLHTCPTFGENIIFMLNRTSSSTPEGVSLQLLILKLLYLLFTTPATSHYFYTNDLRVLVDVFIREISDLGDEHDSLRHTYLRVLHPLLTNTQLKEAPYKSAQVLRLLEGLVGGGNYREVSQTTKRLVERCLGGEWCIQLKRQREGDVSPTSSVTTSGSSQGDNEGESAPSLSRSDFLVRQPSSASGKDRTLRSTRSVGELKKTPSSSYAHPPLPSTSAKSNTIPPIPRNVAVETLQRNINNNESSTSLAALSTTRGPIPVSPPLPPLKTSVSDKHTIRQRQSQDLLSESPTSPRSPRSPLEYAMKGDRTISTGMAGEVIVASDASPPELYVTTPTTPEIESSVPILRSQTADGRSQSTPNLMHPMTSSLPSSSPLGSNSTNNSSSHINANGVSTKSKKLAPPAPPRRRKPPAVPVRNRPNLNGDGSASASARSSTSSLGIRGPGAQRAVT